MNRISCLVVLAAVASFAHATPDESQRVIKRAPASFEKIAAIDQPSIILWNVNPIQAQVLAQQSGAINFEPLSDFGYRLDFELISDAKSKLAWLKSKPGVRACLDQILPYVKDQFVPNDPLYTLGSPATSYPGQWYLNDPTATDADINAPGAWSRNLIGTGMLVGIVDDGLDFTHTDISPNYLSAQSYNFGTNTANPFPVTSADNHGTSIAGFIAGRGGNSNGITGVAPQGRIGAIRVDFNSGVLASQLVSAIGFLGSPNTANQFEVKNHSYGPNAPWIVSSGESSALAANSAAGTVQIRSSGNLRGTTAEDANKSMVRNSVDSITIGAIGSNRVFTSYSAFGACVFACAPSGDDSVLGLRPIIATDRPSTAGFNINTLASTDPNYDGDPHPDLNFSVLYGSASAGGTSVAAAIASGTMLLGFQANPALNTRFAKHLLARTSRQVDATDVSTAGDTWRTNAAGFKFNQNYGFGLIDADAFTNVATQWAGTTALAIFNVPATSVATAIPDNNTTGISRTTSVAGQGRCEEVQVTLNISHAYVGDLEAYVTSPSGTRSRLFLSNGSDDSDNVNWTFTSNAFWGENSNGTWTVQVRDVFASDAGTWNSYAMNIRTGTLQRNLSGTATLGAAWVGAYPVTATVQLLQPGTQTVLQTQNVALPSNGAWTFPTTLSGLVDVRVSASHWLTKRFTNVNLNSASVVAGTVDLVNGNADGDGEVGPGDLQMILDGFGLTTSDPGYSAMADLDGDGEIGPGDLQIVLDFFGTEGDN